ncbi:uncharacterized protein LOC62_03G003862 [Vanrija pseudolonga]|uniref:DUF1996 domain-containing protein n=1 Tax=Vanrija pseudolonga TaxID=143232 RepID=A0AAF0Y557_9TREE|nr:hypothetical protein LOC62_03G003862 [Vanrija pseudolonga]
MIKTALAFKALWALAGVTMVDASFWVIPDIQILTTARMDPIVSPGKVAPHSHTISGASNFRSVLNTPEEQQNAVCSTAPIQADKSNYWSPQIFFINKDNEYEHLSPGSRVYYFAPENSIAFPKGMRMISGIANERNPSALRSQGVFMDCDERPGGTDWLPNGTVYPTACNSIHTNVFMPSCGWANQSLDSWDHFSHLTWPINHGGGQVWENLVESTCPPSHPIKYPTMMVQFNYWTSPRQREQWKTDGSPNFILANGDTTGQTFHVDFVSGWDEDVLNNAIKTCGDIGDRIGDCAAFKPSVDRDRANNCALQSMLPAEEVGFNKPLKNLPGCNPVWGLETNVKPNDCPWHTGDPGWTAPQGSYADNWRTMPLAMDLNSSVVLPHKLRTFGQPDVVTYNGMYGSGLLATWPNDYTGDVVEKGTFDDFKANSNGATAVNKQCQAAGLKDSSAWTGLQPPTIVGQDKWSPLKDFPKTFTWLNKVPQKTENAYLNFPDDLPRPTDGSANDVYNFTGPDGKPMQQVAAAPTPATAPVSSNSGSSEAKPTGVSSSSESASSSDSASSSGSGTAAAPTFSGAAAPVKNVNQLNVAADGPSLSSNVTGTATPSVVNAAAEGGAAPTGAPAGEAYGAGGAGAGGAPSPSAGSSGTKAAEVSGSSSSTTATTTDGAAAGTAAPTGNGASPAPGGTQPTAKPGRCRRKTRRGLDKRRL